jgi:predicted DNA-binding transcriptional regulator AlpA
LVSNSQMSVPILFPYEPEKFWVQIRTIVRDELIANKKSNPSTPVFEIPGMTFKPLYKMAEVCSMFDITKPTVYDWIKHGKLKPIKVQSRVYFLWQDIQSLLQNAVIKQRS